MEERMTSMKAELLAPAGSVETMKAAFFAGADAVYIGGGRFGARAYADNPDDGDLIGAIRYAHLHGKKLYLTVNTLLKEDELEKDLTRWLVPFYEEGLDAVIVQDPGVLRLMRSNFPDLPVHASTQMAMTGVCSAEKLEALGAARLVLPRELSLREIQKIHSACGLELEAFIHGALCYCYSGQCLFSSIAGGRSGNRGRCAQPCRLPYSVCREDESHPWGKAGYLLSPKDLNTLSLLPELLDAGVYSLKIEGRMKKPEYTAGVVSIYRKYLDRILENPGANPVVSEDDERTLLGLFNRKGFTDGYYRRHNGREMITLEAPDPRPEAEECISRMHDAYCGKIQKENGKGFVRIESGKPAIIEMECRGEKVRVQGDEAQEAQARPLSEEDIRRSLEKTKDAAFDWEKLEIATDGHSFLPVSRLNALRREAFETMENALCGLYKRQYTAGDRPAATVRQPDIPEGLPPVSVCCETREQLEECLHSSWISTIYLDSHIGTPGEAAVLAGRVVQSGKHCGYILPRMVREADRECPEQDLKMLRDSGIRLFLCPNAEALLWAGKVFRDGNPKEAPLLAADHTLYTFSQSACEELKEWGADLLTAPVELNGRELSARGMRDTELIVYGYLPMMITAQCVLKTLRGCSKKPEKLLLKDRKGNLFPVRNYCRECYNLILNSLPLSLADVMPQVLALKPSGLRMVFSAEDREETRQVLDLFREALAHPESGAQLQKFTRGHFKRGVE